jgi:predicted HD superfamily hydrolase involved in NAD metabolism
MYKKKFCLSDIKYLLRKSVSYERYQHILSVEKTATFIGRHHNLDLEKLSLVSLLHDWGRRYSIEDMLSICKENNVEVSSIEIESNGLLHAKVGRIEAKECFNINDLDILDAISSHTTGRLNMSSYEEVIFIADYCEPLRKLDDSGAIIQIAIKDLAEAMLKVLSKKIIYVIETERTINPISIKAYNFYQRKYRDKLSTNTSLC